MYDTERNDTHTHISVINGQLEVLEKHRRDLERTLADLERTRDEVVVQQTDLIQKRDELERSLLPVNRIPMELLIHIFTMAVEGAKPDCTPIVLSHVCRLWRQISLHAPEIWHTISFRHFHWNLDMAKAVLARSKETPLDILLDEPAKAPAETQTECVSNLLIFLKEYRGRLHSIFAECSSHQTMLLLLRFFHRSPGSFIRLRSLDLSTEGAQMLDIPSVANEKSAKIFSLPNLHLERISLKCISPSSLPSTFYPSLTWLEISSKKALLSGSAFLLLLQRMVLLEVLVLDETIPDMRVFDDHLVESGDIVLPRLTRLDWSSPTSSEVYRFLCFLSLPALETMTLRVDTHRTFLEPQLSSLPHKPIELPAMRELCLQCTGEDFTSLRRLSFPQLERLELENVAHGKPARVPSFESIFRLPLLPFLTHLTLSNWKLSELRGILGYVPTLTSLGLEVCVGSEHLLRALVKSAWCPRLEALTFWADQMGFEALSELIRARNERPVDVVLTPPTANGRKIRQLPKARRPQLPSPPSRVAYVRLENCENVSEDQAMMLKAMGVADVVWVE